MVDSDTDPGCTMGSEPKTSGGPQGGLDWAAPTLLDLTRSGERVLVVGTADDALAGALESAGREVRTAPPVRPGALSSAEAMGAGTGDVETIVLADALSWVRDEVRYLRDVVASSPDGARLIVVVPNVAWLPRRLSLLAGRSPFGTGRVADRPLRFFARHTLLDALGAAGAGPADVRAVVQEPPPAGADLPSGVVAEVRGLADADVIGFVAVAGPTSESPEDVALLDPNPIRVAARQTVGERIRAEVREQERRAVDRQLATASEVAGLRSRVQELESERDRLAPAADELEVVRARLGYRGLVRLEEAAGRVPFAMAFWRRVSGLVRRGR